MHIMLFKEKEKYSLKNSYNGEAREVLINGGKKLGAELIYEFQMSDLQKIGAIFDYVEKCNKKEEEFDKNKLEMLLSK